MMLKSYNQFWSKNSTVDSDLIIPISGTTQTLKAKLISYQPRNIATSLLKTSQDSGNTQGTYSLLIDLLKTDLCS